MKKTTLATTLTGWCWVLGGLGLLAEVGNMFPGRDGAVGIAGAILFGAGVVATAITEVRKQDDP